MVNYFCFSVFISCNILLESLNFSNQGRRKEIALYSQKEKREEEGNSIQSSSLVKDVELDEKTNGLQWAVGMIEIGSSLLCAFVGLN